MSTATKLVRTTDATVWKPTAEPEDSPEAAYWAYARSRMQSFAVACGFGQLESESLAGQPKGAARSFRFTNGVAVSVWPNVAFAEKVIAQGRPTPHHATNTNPTEEESNRDAA